MPSLIINEFNNPTTAATLLHWYSFDNTLNDLVGNSNLTVNGNGSDTAYVTGINSINSAIKNTNSESISLNSAFYTESIFFSAGNDYSVAAWIYIEDWTSSYEHILFDCATYYDKKGTSIRLYPDHTCSLLLYAGDSPVSYDIEHGVSYNTWTHVSFTFNYSGKELKYYKNGIYITNVTNVSNAWSDPTTQKTEIMGRNAYGIPGCGLDDARYYSGILTDDEVFRIYKYLG